MLIDPSRFYLNASKSRLHVILLGIIGNATTNRYLVFLIWLPENGRLTNTLLYLASRFIISYFICETFTLFELLHGTHVLS